MAMELRHIRYFLAVAEEHHFTRAARRLGIGQPPLSHQIKDLETEVGAPLFHRLPHGAELTAAGQAFLERVKDMPALAEQATKAARRASRGETGSLCVGFIASFAFNPTVPVAIRAFRRDYADVHLTLVEADTSQIVSALEDGSFDAGFVRPGSTNSEALQFRVLSEEEMIVVLPANHRAARAKEVSLASLKDEPWLLFPRAAGPTVYDSIIAACREAGFEPELAQIA